eukprot:8190835-Alexandrium_andersonii.AAC.1
MDRLIARARQGPDSFGWVDGRGPESWGPVLPGAWPTGKARKDYIVAVYCCVGTIQTCKRPL